MFSKVCTSRALLLLLLVIPLAWEPVQSDEERPGKEASELTAAAKKRARNLVLGEKTFKDMLTAKERQFMTEKMRGPVDEVLKVKDKVYVTNYEMVPPKDDGERPRERTRALGKVLVTTYRYQNDEAIVSTVDLDENKVLKVERFPHLPVPLAAEELDNARELAYRQPEVAKALKGYGDKVEVQPLLPRPAEKDPAFGHRIVQLLFVVDKRILSTPRVRVDLTTNKVEVNNAAPAAPVKQDHRED